MYKFFGGLTNEAIAEILGIARATVARDWKLARMKLYAELFEQRGGARPISE